MRILSTFHEFVHENAPNFSEELKKEIKTSFNKVTKGQKANLTDAADVIQKGISTDFTRMIKGAESKPRNDKEDAQKSQLKEDVSKLLRQFTATPQNMLNISEIGGIGTNAPEENEDSGSESENDSDDDADDKHDDSTNSDNDGLHNHDRSSEFAE